MYYFDSNKGDAKALGVIPLRMFTTTTTAQKK